MKFRDLLEEGAGPREKEFMDKVKKELGKDHKFAFLTMDSLLKVNKKVDAAVKKYVMQQKQADYLLGR